MISFRCVYVLTVLCLVTRYISASNYSFIDLPPTHLSKYFRNFPNIAHECRQDPECPYQQFLEGAEFKKSACWGYEENCARENADFVTQCAGNHSGWVKSKEDQIETFYSQTDYGYVHQQLNEMSVMCAPLFVDDSSLECSKNLRFCRGRNLMLNFTDLNSRDHPIRYKMDVLQQGQIGGYCDLDQSRLDAELAHLSPLQSWAPELRYFEKLPKRPIPDNQCDIVIEKPTFLMKIDATVNMYHHFCDFFNLYASLHVNMSHALSFDTDVHILIWESFTYESPFKEAFKAFTKNQIWDLKTFRGEVVCFKNLVFPLLPRMIFGLYYNTPIIYGCENSELFHSFSEHMMHRLAIPVLPKTNRKLKVTFLSRKTKYRKILNEDELLEEISKDDRYIVQRVTFERQISFREQLKITRNSDIFIGMHGAGLTHLLFLPDWGAIFELYNCEDPACYQDLARLRGVYYLTWENNDKLVPQDEGHHPDGGKHAKFTNYSFDKAEFARLVAKAADHVVAHEKYQKFIESAEHVPREEL